jgi:hypothetical protein
MSFVIVTGRPDPRPGRNCDIIGPFDTEIKAHRYKVAYLTNRLCHIDEVSEPVIKPQFWEMPSDNEDIDYLVKLGRDGSWTCTCKDHIYRERECKHIMRAQCEFYGVKPGQLSI